MNKKIATYCLLAAGAAFTSGVFAEPKFIDEDVFSIDVTPTVIKTSTLAMNVTNEFTSNGNIGPNQRLFTLNVSTAPGTSIAVAARDDGSQRTRIRSFGDIISAGIDGSTSAIRGYLNDEYKSKLTTNTDYFPPNTRTDDNAAVILLKGENSYAIDVTTSPENGSNGQYDRPGEYVFSFIAQAYTE